MQLDEDMTETERRDLWNWARGRIAAVKRENDTLRATIARGERNIEHWERIEKACLPNPCGGCSGHGKIREWLAQDESNVVTCGSCGGSGKAKAKPGA